ncbi:Probable WRKY transcription factor 14 [Striga hermonthica]|uniref:Probable WRKY transcription factor 14 n=1 Tax=Striga hermonthica TaxID=68872 RepID=A0A9N7N663_STRHE|nr:Probable WRKY transcription factor 14 [Striga hermonthica]
MENNTRGDLSDIVRAAALDWPLPPAGAGDPIGCPADRDFGDPFSLTGDPLLHNLDPEPPVSSGFFYGSGAVDRVVNTPPGNIFSKMLQISPSDAKLPCVPAGVLKAPAPILVSNNNNKSSSSRSNNNNNSRDGGLISSPASGVQISSPVRNTGIKRRKCQAKKVVCIPAPAPANSRASGEVVPSDLWAWRKYGQKPIKGSPYPR